MKRYRANVVIVEDDSVFRRGLVRLFEKENCSVFDFGDARRALEHIRNNTPDFVVCDYKLPGMNGLEFLQELRNDSVSTPFVLVTAHFSDEIQELALSSGALAAITKPLNVEGLRSLFDREIAEV